MDTNARRCFCSDALSRNPPTETRAINYSVLPFQGYDSDSDGPIFETKNNEKSPSTRRSALGKTKEVLDYSGCSTKKSPVNNEPIDVTSSDENLKIRPTSRNMSETFDTSDLHRPNFEILAKDDRVTLSSDESLDRVRPVLELTDDSPIDKDSCARSPRHHAIETHDDNDSWQSDAEMFPDDDTDTSSDSDVSIFKDYNSPYESPRSAVIEIRDNFLMRRDNLVIFITRDGRPCDEGARMLFEAEKPFRILDCVIGRAKVIEYKNKYLIALPIKENEACTVRKDDFNQSLRSLKDVIRELELHSISLCKSNIVEMDLKSIFACMRHVLADTSVKMCVCTNKIVVPPVTQCEAILQENHCSAIGGHKGISKTYQRVRHKYY